MSNFIINKSNPVYARFMETTSIIFYDNIIVENLGKSIRSYTHIKFHSKQYYLRIWYPETIPICINYPSHMNKFYYLKIYNKMRIL